MTKQRAVKAYLSGYPDFSSRYYLGEGMEDLAKNEIQKKYEEVKETALRMYAEAGPINPLRELTDLEWAKYHIDQAIGPTWPMKKPTFILEYMDVNVL